MNVLILPYSIENKNDVFNTNDFYHTVFDMFSLIESLLMFSERRFDVVSPPQHEYRGFPQGEENAVRHFGLNPSCNLSHNLKVGGFLAWISLKMILLKTIIFLVDSVSNISTLFLIF